MSSDIRAVTVTEDGVAFNGRARVKSVSFLASASAGSIVIRDGGATGAVLLNIATPAVADYNEVTIPADGILCQSGIYVDLTNVTSATIFHG